MHQGKDGPSRRELLLARLENYRAARQEAPPSQREEFEMRIRRCMSQLRQLENDERDGSDEPAEAPVIPTFD